jgi:HPt (histidine-containing phosphotransfer) domain-containing protein
LTIPLPPRDLDEALAITGGSRAVADEMLRELLAELPGQLASAADALDAGDWDGLRSLAHRMKGSSAMCALPALHAAVCALQAAARAGERSQTMAEIGRAALEHARLAASLGDGAPP